MSIDNIIFEADDTAQQTAIKTALLFAGSNELKTQLKKIGIVNYSKVVKGAKVSYILRGNKIGRLTVTL